MLDRPGVRQVDDGGRAGVDGVQVERQLVTIGFFGSGWYQTGLPVGRVMAAGSLKPRTPRSAPK
jgi:hypothetical protein